MNKQGRIAWIDSLKGLAILFVVMGHLCQRQEVIDYIYSFHVMLFFLISGSFLDLRKYPHYKTFLLSRIRQLYVPYVLLFVASFTIWLLVERHFRPDSPPWSEAIIGLFYGTGKYLFAGGSVWFLAALFSLENLVYFCLRLPNDALRYGSLAAAFVAGILLADYYVLPLSLNNALLVIPFFAVGYLLRDKIRALSLWKTTAAAIAIIALGLSVVLSGTVRIDISSLIVSNYWLYLTVPFTGIAGWALLAYVMGDRTPLLQWLGRNTLPILGFHAFVYRVVATVAAKAVGIDQLALRSNIFTCLLLLVVVMVALYPFIRVWGVVYPWILGKLDFLTPKHPAGIS